MCATVIDLKSASANLLPHPSSPSPPTYPTDLRAADSSSNEPPLYIQLSGDSRLSFDGGNLECVFSAILGSDLHLINNDDQGRLAFIITQQYEAMFPLSSQKIQILVRIGVEGLQYNDKDYLHAVHGGYKTGT